MTNDYFKKRRKETGTKIVKQNFSTNAANISTKSLFSSTNGFLGGWGKNFRHLDSGNKKIVTFAFLSS